MVMTNVVSESESIVSPIAGADEAAKATDLRWYVFGLFFVFGGVTSLDDVRIPKLKHLFSLSYFEAMLVQFAFSAAYFIVSLPAASLVRRWGNMRAATIGLLTMAAGCLLFIPASLTGLFYSLSRRLVRAR